MTTPAAPASSSLPPAPAPAACGSVGTGRAGGEGSRRDLNSLFADLPVEAREAAESAIPTGAPPAEAALAGAVLLDAPATVREVLPPLTLADFTDPAARLTWSWAADRVAAGLPVDVLLAAEALRDRVPVAMLESFVDACAAVAHVGYYADLIREAGKRRALVSLADRVKAIASRPDTAPDLLREEIAAAVEATRTANAGALAAIVNAGAYLDTLPPSPDQIIEGMIEPGDKAGVIASAKRKKTWFVTQLATCVASGRPFLGWAVPKPRRVLVVQPEIKAAHYHRRLRYMAEAMRINSGDLGDRLGIVNARGTPIDASAILRLAVQFRAELVIVDPLYKITEGDENKAEDVKPTLAAFDQIATRTGAAVLWVHHDSKGTPGDRDARDRGAGSNILIRDVDQLLTLTPHRDDPEATVVETLARNHRDMEPKTITWENGCFIESNLAATPRTSKNPPSRFADPLRKLDAEEPGLTLSEAAARLGCNKTTVLRLRSQRGVA